MLLTIKNQVVKIPQAFGGKMEKRDLGIQGEDAEGGSGGLGSSSDKLGDLLAQGRPTPSYSFW